MIRLSPIHYVSDVALFTRFYEALGLLPEVASRTGNWVELTARSGTLALHSFQTDDGPLAASKVELSFEAELPLEEISNHLHEAGFDPGVIVDESFGRSLQLRDPDGTRLQINENDRELYT